MAVSLFRKTGAKRSVSNRRACVKIIAVCTTASMTSCSIPFSDILRQYAVECLMLSFMLPSRRCFAVDEHNQQVNRFTRSDSGAHQLLSDRSSFQASCMAIFENPFCANCCN
jgi:hypothetical protein